MRKNIYMYIYMYFEVYGYIQYIFLPALALLTTFPNFSRLFGSFYSAGDQILGRLVQEHKNKRARKTQAFDRNIYRKLRRIIQFHARGYEIQKIIAEFFGAKSTLHYPLGKKILHTSPTHRSPFFARQHTITNILAPASKGDDKNVLSPLLASSLL